MCNTHCVSESLKKEVYCCSSSPLGTMYMQNIYLCCVINGTERFSYQKRWKIIKRRCLHRKFFLQKCHVGTISGKRIFSEWLLERVLLICSILDQLNISVYFCSKKFRGKEQSRIQNVATAKKTNFIACFYIERYLEMSLL